ncbi:MAG: hypothetical protein M3Y53_10515 [Thermoproteota archaeon]|nr:hypothetical protein [Thermoproteota archaeon]
MDLGHGKFENLEENTSHGKVENLCSFWLFSLVKKWNNVMEHDNLTTLCTYLQVTIESRKQTEMYSSVFMVTNFEVKFLLLAGCLYGVLGIQQR